MFRYNARTLSICVVLLLLLSFFLLNQRHEDVRLKSIAVSQTFSKKLVTKINANGSNLRSKGPVKKRPQKQPEKRFFVFGPQCKIPYVNPFDKSFMGFGPPKFISCSNDSDLISVFYDPIKRQYRLHVNEEVARKNFPSYENFACTYQEVCSGPTDTTAFLGNPVYIDQDWLVPAHFLGVIVECHEVRNTSRVLQRDAFSFVQYPRDRNEKSDARRGAKYPNVFLFGIDSMSRMNFRRTMPLTSKFVRQKGWYEMKGYNKVGDNTLPNLLAVLTGRTPKQWRSKCDVRQEGCLDRLTYLWDHFRHAGYLTAYAEDLATISTFNYMNYGFARQPVDFYLRHFLLVIEQAMSTKEFRGQNYCVARRHSFTYVLDYAKQLIERFVLEDPKPLFGLFWTSSATHDDFQGGRNLDKPFARYLEQFQEYGLFQKSIVILFSDHGSRFGPLAEHITGFLEERLPMLHIYLPPCYRQRYPRVARALNLNRHRLSSNFDLYVGLTHIIKQIRPRVVFPHIFRPHTVRSLLQVLPRNRTCAQAGIAEHWCTCNAFVDVPVSPFFEALAKLTVDRMNGFLRMLNVDGDCHLITLHEVLKADRQLHFSDSGYEVAAPNGLETFALVFSTHPNDATFRSIIRSNYNHSIVHNEIDMISRLNSYGNQSYCVRDVVAKKFCLCRKDKFLKIHQKQRVKRVRKVKYEFKEDREDEFYDENKFLTITFKNTKPVDLY